MFNYPLIPIAIMTHPIYSIIEHAMLLYRIVPASSCKGCAFNNEEENLCMRPKDWYELCSDIYREDNIPVIFINIGELEFSYSLDKV